MLNRTVVSLLIISVSALALHASEPLAPRIIFADDFESGDFSKWDDETTKDDPARLHLTDDSLNVFQGKYAAELTVSPDGPQGATLNKWFMPGYDRVYARFHAKFAEDFDQGNHMHWVHFLGNRIDNKWSAFGKAGLRPGGTDFFTVGIEPWRAYGKNPPPGRFMFYTYHMDMPLDTKTDKYYGQMYLSDPPFIVERGKWYRFEVMVKANTPGQADGEQALWVDGKPILRTGGLRFRTTDEVRINAFWLLLYLHDTPKTNTCWFDDLLLSQDPIGPYEAAAGVENEEPR